MSNTVYISVSKSEYKFLKSLHGRELVLGDNGDILYIKQSCEGMTLIDSDAIIEITQDKDSH